MAHELRTGGGDSDPGLVIVEDEKHLTVLSIPFLAGFAWGSISRKRQKADIRAVPSELLQRRAIAQAR